ncbi:MAG: D-alanine--D-alanine ligase [Desulfobulbaceae bacterium]|nr:D-alanine--D-alanine ligase [Desulfobulbaceae bacterium]
MAKLRLALIAGGVSAEREVSLRGAAGVEQALNRDRYEVVRYDPATDLARIAADAANIDAAFILLHGVHGEDGTIQGFLDLLGIPYQGAGVLGSALAMDKNLAKVMYRLAGLPVAPWVMVEPGDLRDSGRIESAVGLPCVVKPVRQGSSIGMSIVRTRDQLPAALELALRHDGEVMVEAFLKGRELTAGVLGNSELTALPLIEIIPDSRYDFFNYEAKYQPGATREVCPAPVSETVRARAQDYAVRAHRSLQLRGYSRTDMIVVGEELYLLETNTIPGMTPTSLLPQAAAEAGLPFAALLDRLIELALERPAGPQG